MPWKASVQQRFEVTEQSHSLGQGIADKRNALARNKLQRE
jgi:hypothetical protein